MSRGYYHKDEILEKERHLLQVLGWHVNPATVMDFSRLYLDLLGHSVGPLPHVTYHPRVLFHSSCQDLAERVLQEDHFISKPNSTIALAVVLLTLQRRQSAHMIEPLLKSLQGLVNAQDFDDILASLERL